MQCLSRSFFFCLDIAPYIVFYIHYGNLEHVSTYICIQYPIGFFMQRNGFPKVSDIIEYGNNNKFFSFQFYYLLWSVLKWTKINYIRLIFEPSVFFFLFLRLPSLSLCLPARREGRGAAMVPFPHAAALINVHHSSISLSRCKHCRIHSLFAPFQKPFVFLQIRDWIADKLRSSASSWCSG